MSSHTHGPRHDVFLRQSGTPHGGAQFDEGFGLQEHVDTHGKLHDLFGVPSDPSLHGARYDEFGWQEMPVLHGGRFDEAFDEPTAHSGDHATWFDAFRGGAQVRFRSDGSDYEGVVIDCNTDFATVKSHQGEREVLYSQVTAWRKHPTEAGAPARKGVKVAEPGDTPTGFIDRSDAEAPSAHSHEAAGGGERTQVDPGIVDQIVANKTAYEGWEDLGDLLDVCKAVSAPKSEKLPNPKGGMASAVATHKNNLHQLSSYPRTGKTPTLHCPGCGKHEKYDVGHTPVEKRPGGPVTSKMWGHCKGCGFKHNFSPPKYGSRQGKLAKTVDAAETAVQKQDLEGDGAGKVWCKKCKHYCRRDEHGKCPTCGGETTAKSVESDADVLKRLRETAGALA